jgi:glutamate dehydrogenase
VALQVLRSRRPTSRRSISRPRPRFAEALDRLWSGARERRPQQAGPGRGLAWREVAVLRAYAKYLRQAGIPFSQDYMERALVAYPAIARGTSSCSRPASIRRSARDAARRSMRRGDASPGARERGDARRGPHPATLPECGALQPAPPTTGSARIRISFKVDSRTIDELPAPRPMVEVFVYSPRMEGIHLRGGKVGARRHPLVRPARGLPDRNSWA